jgi:hypothetical protein
MCWFRPRRGSELAGSERSSFVGKSRVLMLGSFWAELRLKGDACDEYKVCYVDLGG